MVLKRFIISIEGLGKGQELLKKFNLFVVETVAEQVDPKSHPIRLTYIHVTDIGSVKSNIARQKRKRILSRF